MSVHIRPRSFWVWRLTMSKASNGVWRPCPPHPNRQDGEISSRNIRLQRPYSIPPLRNRAALPRRRASSSLPELSQESTAGVEDTTTRREELGKQRTISHIAPYCGLDCCCRDFRRRCSSHCYFERGDESCRGHTESVEIGEVFVGEWEELSYY